MLVANVEDLIELVVIVFMLLVSERGLFRHITFQDDFLSYGQDFSDCRATLKVRGLTSNSKWGGGGAQNTFFAVTL